MSKWKGTVALQRTFLSIRSRVWVFVSLLLIRKQEQEEESKEKKKRSVQRRGMRY